ncbi:MAG TPA: DUF1956 domain-containing protein, partial [Roseimicrobium sp.]|nr:DUF1956 domain-containing protein [Roseimicrobium sp.]
AGLYSAVLNESAALALKAYPPNLGLSPKATPEERLHAFVRSFLLRVYSEGAHSCHSRLMSRELVEPTPALDLLAKQTVAPMAAQLRGIIRTLAGTAASEADIRRCSLSVVSQVLFYHHGRPMIDRVFPGFRMDAAEIEALASHITQFSLAGIRQLKSRTQKR